MSAPADIAVTRAAEARRYGARVDGELAALAGYIPTEELVAFRSSAGRRVSERQPAHPPTGPSAPAGSNNTGGTTMDSCKHLAAERSPVEMDPPGGRACTDCLREGTRWVHLRECLDCGHVGCCDNSPRKHATAHF